MYYYFVLAFFLALVISLAIYLNYAGTHGKWPFIVNTKIISSLKSRDTSNKNYSTELPVWAGLSIFIIFIILFIVIIYFSIKTSMARYKLAGEALKSGNKGLAVAALAPEIGEGIGAGLGGLFGNQNNNINL